MLRKPAGDTCHKELQVESTAIYKYSHFETHCQLVLAADTTPSYPSCSVALPEQAQFPQDVSDKDTI